MLLKALKRAFGHFYKATTTDLAVAQLLQYNCFVKYTEGAATQRHSRDREIPFLVYVGLSVYAKTRKKHLVEILKGIVLVFHIIEYLIYLLS